MYKDHRPYIQLPQSAGWRASESHGDASSACGAARPDRSVPRVRAHVRPQGAPHVDASEPGASGCARRAPAPPNAQHPGPYRGRAPRQRPANPAVATHRDSRRAGAKAAVVAAAPSVARHQCRAAGSSHPSSERSSSGWSRRSRLAAAGALIYGCCY